MKPRTPPPGAPRLRPLADHGPAEVRAILAAARRLEPPPGAQERVWEALVRAHAGETAFDAGPGVAALLAAARASAEPPAGARERIWARLEEEALARAGVAEPARLLDSDPAVAPILAAAARLEPPVGRRTRLRPEPGPARWRWTLALPSAALAAAALFLVVRPAESPDELALATPPAAPATGKIPSEIKEFALTAGSRISAPSASGRALRVAGIGEFVLVGDAARLTVEAAGPAGARVRLEDGAVAIHAEKRPAGSPLVIVGAGVEAEVVGTIFAVSTDGRASAVDVIEGIVQVRHDAGTVRLTAGRALAVGPDADSKKAQSVANAAALRRLTGTSARTLVPPAPAKASAPAAPLAAPPRARPTSLTAAPAAVHAAEPAPAPGPRDEAARELAALARPTGASSAALRERARDALARRDWEAATAALFAVAHHPDLPPADRASALVTTADLFDLELGRPWAAILVREKLAAESASHGAAAQFALMLGYFDVGALEEARGAAGACVQRCAEELRPIAMFVRARVLQEAGDPGLLDAARELRRVPQGARATALHFSERADRFVALGQAARARRAASFALALDPRGPNAGHLRAIIGDR